MTRKMQFLNPGYVDGTVSMSLDSLRKCARDLGYDVVPAVVKPEASLVLWGKCPAKKNLWKRARGGHSFLDVGVKAQIDALTTQARGQWGRPAVEHPELNVSMFIHHARRDQDGIYTTILDCMQSAGILVNDNSAHNNGRKILEPCRFVEETEERVEIEIRKGM